MHRATRMLHVAILATLLVATPLATATSHDTDPRLSNCSGVECIRDALLGVWVRIIGALGNLFTAPIAAVAAGVAGLFAAFFGVFGKDGFFGGLAESLREMSSSIFDGVRGSFREGWGQLSGSLKWFGPLAPVVAVAVVVLVFLVVSWLITRAFDRADDPLPRSLESINKDSDAD